LKNLLQNAFMATTFLLFICSTANAKRFANQYTEFELPPGWNCAIEGSEWVCQSTNKDRQKEAIIILAAKIRGGKDNLAEYQGYLNKPKTYQLPGGKIQKSEPKYAKKKDVNGHTWIDSLHLASEVPGFYTRYLATVKEDLGVAITFSVTKELYNAYQSVFDNIIASMRVFRQKKTKLAKVPKGMGSGAGDFDDTTFAPNEQYDIGAGGQKKKKAGGGGSDDLMLYGIIGAAVAFFLLRKKKGKKGGKKKKRG
jgi:hypothetical protein